VQETFGNQSVDGAEAPTTGPRPRLVYDGDCGFCGYWARYWRKLTGASVDYKTYQEGATKYPTIPVADFQRAVQYIAPDGTSPTWNSALPLSRWLARPLKFNTR
jgi:hypothetical protein